jgi:hypothetical protein
MSPAANKMPLMINLSASTQCLDKIQEPDRGDGGRLRFVTWAGVPFRPTSATTDQRTRGRQFQGRHQFRQTAIGGERAMPFVQAGFRDPEYLGNVAQRLATVLEIKERTDQQRIAPCLSEDVFNSAPLAGR